MKIAKGLFCTLLGIALWSAVLPAEAIPLRIATWNVLHGVDTGHDHLTNLNDDYSAVTSIVQRVQPDIICFQELTSTDKADWLTAGATLGYQYYAIPTNAGPFSGSLLPGIWSKHPLTNVVQIKENYIDPTATMFTRWPLHAEVQVPGALQPFHVFVVHNKSTTLDTESRLWRALEIYRTANWITNWMANYPLDSEFAIMGDWNDSIEGSVGLGQTETFAWSYYTNHQPDMGNLTYDFNAGSDIPWTTNSGWLLPYKMYPTERLTNAGMSEVAAPHTGGTNTWTHDNNPPADTNGYRLDYILFSDEIANNAYGPPAGEVYSSRGDFASGGAGLTKYGLPLATEISPTASDHRMVFADFNLIDEVGGITPVGIISEIVDHPTTTNANYVEICNTGIGTLDMSAYKLAIYLDKNKTAVTNIPLSGTLDSGQVYTLATSTSIYFSTYGVAADKQSVAIGRFNGNDAVALLRSNKVSDVYGKIGAFPGLWGYTNSTAVRKQGISDPLTVWSSVEWTLTAGTNAATPGVHASMPDAAVSVAGTGLDPFAPKATNAFAIKTSIFRNRAATNLSARARFRISGGNWITNAMTNSSGYVWQTPAMDVAKNGGDVMEYCVEIAFYDANYGTVSTNSPKISATNAYTFPAGTGTTARIMPLFNEVQANGNGTDSNEFVELIAPAGTNLVGYTMKQYNGATNLDGVLWTYTFPSFTVPDDGILDFGSNHLGFVVVGQNSNTVANADLILGQTLNNGPHALILYDSATNIVDAVVWLAATNDAFDTDGDDPGTVSRIVPGGSPSFLHEIGVDQPTDFCPQAPNNVLMAAGTWYSALATPGTLNAAQTNAYLFVARLDLDQDGVLDDEDNCASYNPTQIDTDGDGQGDECDADIDGDGVLNAADNCTYEGNASQSDMDYDGEGDACDDDIDGDGLANEDDSDPYTPTTQIFNFEAPADLAKTIYATLTPEFIANRYWVLSNAVISSSASDLTNGLKSLRLRAPGEFILQGMLTNGIGSFSFNYGRYGTDAGVAIEAQYKKGTNDWTAIATVSSAGVTNLAASSSTANVLGPVEFRFVCSGGTDLRANVDDIVIAEYTLPDEPVDALCALAATNEATYDGYEHPNDFIVYPEGIDYSVEYTLASVPTNPVGVGTYTATVTIPDVGLVTGGTFVYTDSVIIAQGAAVCTLGSAVSTAFDGLAHTNDFSVTPGMAWSVAYAPGDPPMEPGSYDATVTVTGNDNATGGVFAFANAVVITQAMATCSMGAQITTNYDGGVHTNGFTVTPGLLWSVVYSPENPPVNAGVYHATVAVVGDSRYVGGAFDFAGAVTILSTNQDARTVATNAVVINFESPYLPDYATYGPHTNVLCAASPSNWFLLNATRGNLSNDVKTGSYSLRMVYVGAAATSNGVLQSLGPFAGIHSAAFNYAMYGTDSTATLGLQTSVDGHEWTSHANLVVTNRTTFAAYSNTLALTKARYLRFQLVAGNAQQRVNLDDIVVLPYDPLPATVALGNLAHFYDARPKSATATTDPAGLAVRLTYNGATNLPVAIGSYTVVGTVAAPEYAGAATGTLTIVQGDFAPWFTALGVQTAKVGAASSFTTGANGYPAPTLALQGTTASTGYVFTAGSGLLAYTPPQADVDATKTFTFTASNNLGVDTQTVSVVVQDGPPAAPASIRAGATNNAGFTADWDAVAIATSYRLDVAASELFDGSSAGRFVLASNAATSPGLITNDWSGFNLSGSTYVTLLTATSAIVSPAFSTLGFTNLTVNFQARTYGGTTKSNITVSISTNNGTAWTVLGVVNPLNGATWSTIPTITNVANLGFAQTRIRWQSLDAGSGIGVGVSNLVIQGWSVAAAPSYVSGYSNLTVAGTSQSVEGLAAGATYYFRARAVSAGGTSLNSPVATVTTKSGTPPILDSIDAQTATVAVDFDYTVVAMPTETDPMTYSCTSAVSESAWLFDTNSGYFYFLPGTNQIGANVFVFAALDKDGSSSPAAMTVTVGTTLFQDWVMGRGQDPGSSNYTTNSDVDGDGMNTWQEYLADTDPALSGSVLRLTGTYSISSASNVTGLMRMAFPASTTRYYQLVYSTNLFSSTIVSNLGWGSPGMVVSNNTSGTWYGMIRALLVAP